MAHINGIAIHPGFFNRKATRTPEYRVGASIARTSIKKSIVTTTRAPKAKHAMPVIAIVAAIGSFAAGAAIATAATATIGAMIVGGMMMVGAAMSVVGTISGNAKLAKWGGILTMVGGVGALGLGAAGMLTEGAATAASGAAGGAAETAGTAALPTDVSSAASGATATPLPAEAPVVATTPTTTPPVAVDPATTAISTSAANPAATGVGATTDAVGAAVPTPAAAPTPPSTSFTDSLNAYDTSGASPSGMLTAPSTVDASTGIDLAKNPTDVGLDLSSISNVKQDPSLLSQFQTAYKDPLIKDTVGGITSGIGALAKEAQARPLINAQIGGLNATANYHNQSAASVLQRRLNGMTLAQRTAELARQKGGG